MTSPFASFANATLTFDVPITGSSVDPVTGNRVVNRQAIAVQAMLNSQSRSGGGDKVGRAAGVDLQAVYLEGFATEPSQLPASIQPNTWAIATWAGKSGKFLLLVTAPDSFGASAVTGTKIRGWFQTST